MKTKWKVVSPHTGLEEDAPTNSAGSGLVHGIGVGPHGEPGVDPKKKKKQTLIGRNGKIDGRSKAYREHRKNLEAARQKRLERKNSNGSKFIESIKKKSMSDIQPINAGKMSNTRLQHQQIKQRAADKSNKKLQVSKKKKKK